MFIFTYTAAILSIVCFGIAAFILVIKRKEYLAKYLGAYVLFVGVWIGSNAMADVSITDLTERFWCGMALLGGAFFIAYYFCFIEFFVTEQRPGLFKKSIIFLPSIIFSVLGFTKFYVVETMFPGDSPAQIIPGIINYPYLFYVFGAFIYGLIRLITHYKKASSLKKKQIFYIGNGLLVVLLSGIIFDSILPLLGEYRFFSLGPQASIIMIFLAAYAIFKHKLLDIKIVIQRSIIYTVLFVFIIAIYLATLFLTLYIFGEFSGGANYLISTILTIFIGIFGVPKIEKYFRRITDKIFFKDKYDYSEELRALSEIVSKNVKIKDILSKSMSKLKQIFKVADVYYIYLPERSMVNSQSSLGKIKELDIGDVLKEFSGIKEIIVCSEISYTLKKGIFDAQYYKTLVRIDELCRKYNIGVVIPFVVEEQIIGAVLLSPKLSGDEYTEEDVIFLRTFAHEASTALIRARLYEEVKSYSENLETKVLERTAEIKNLREQQAQMMLDIAHQLKTPLAVIKGELSIIKKDFPKNKKFDLFESRIDKTSNFINTLLKLAKMEFCSSTDMKKEIINFSELINEQIEYFIVLVKPQKIKIFSDVISDIYIYGEKYGLQDLVINLVSNSIKYIANQREITIRLHARGDKAVLTVEDTGLGIPKEDIPHLFNRFYRPRMRRMTEGAGLGLAICQKIIEDHGGKIFVESELGKGTKVVVEFKKINPSPVKESA